MVPDTDVLTRVCGTNDNNLKLIEKHLGVPIFTRGNELSVESGDPALQQQFRFIIDRIMDELHDGADGSQDMIVSVLNSGREGGRAPFESGAITVPGGVRRVYPKTENHARYVQALRNYDMVFCTGPAGSGKTFIAVAEALRQVLTRKKSTIILTRPVVEAGESLGFLPGDLEQKINPYLRPLYDAMEMVVPKETVKKNVRVRCDRDRSAGIYARTDAA